MPLIQQLPSHLADMIAAGEVVERPASVVKELLENTIDAGASAVSVELRGGGMSLIRVSDNGCGIAPEELPTAFLRHATSKLRTEKDLSCIGTLGFRGEALAAIAAVSRIEITSRRRGAARGARMSLEGGTAGAVEECGCPEGTTISVHNLFFNTPARMKFMKKDSAEASAAAAVVQHEALSHARISFKLTRDGTEQLYTPGDGKLLSAIYSVLGREFALSLLAVEGSGSAVAVDGFATRSLQGRGTRAMQHFFVNGRYVKSPLLSAALEEAYRNQIMKGKFPGCVLHLSLPLDAVDVNVHPAKTVVKFLNERAVFDAVYYAVKSALEQGGERPAAPAPSPRPFPCAAKTESLFLPDHDGTGIPCPDSARQTADQLFPAAGRKYPRLRMGRLGHGSRFGSAHLQKRPAVPCHSGAYPASRTAGPSCGGKCRGLPACFHLRAPPGPLRARCGRGHAAHRSAGWTGTAGTVCRTALAHRRRGAAHLYHCRRQSGHRMAH